MELRKNTKQLRTIRFQLLLAVNVTLGLGLAGLLLVRYQHEMGENVAEKHSGLVDEAIAIHQAVAHILREHPHDNVQSYLDDLCERMRSSRSPGHQIVVRTKDATYACGANASESRNILQAMERAFRDTDYEAQLDGSTLVVGSEARNGLTVHVAEYVTNIRRAIRTEVLAEIAVLVCLGLIAAAIVNAILLKMVDAPINRLLATVQQIGDGEFGVQAPDSSSREIHVLAQAINRMSTALHENDSQRRFQMEKARQIQEHLLPNGTRVPGLETARLFQPAEGVAGDYYDLLPLRDGTWLICLADVTGHGIPAAMGAAILKALLLTAADDECLGPTEVLEVVNQRFTRTVLPGNFASMFLGRWSPEKQELTYASAGHESAILLAGADSRIELLTSTGLLLGAQLEAEWEQHSLVLAPFDRILLFSDGATETRSPDGELFRRERLTASFSRFSELSLEETLDRLEQTLIEHRGAAAPEDDLTLVLLQCSAGEASVPAARTDDAETVAHRSEAART